MTYDELVKWGRAEAQIRAKELEAVTDEESLETVKRAAEVRRKAVGLTASRAALAVLLSFREDQL